jgi:hypothetical protein
MDGGSRQQVGPSSEFSDQDLHPDACMVFIPP